ncbi:branched-chain amino acid transport system permease protein [Geodermatophilus dictyosporus]|uniref:Branched-chain amino acid transport system permease protein n=1 Tax=Geodermatophilus dictyosporus TaxID=1523247 RepID=A0A1I5MZF5_9ACTN|nr:branched-chain amino acid ABC transporter permease [Geodermatophilus dictyosporus]SFP14839.1 branched-chain amino acid transport system permease protein [Geodermatophilus dictyosporus]
MREFINLTLGGVITGAVYAAFALALVLIWRSTRIVNFAQGAMAAITTFIALSLIESGQSYWVGLAVALLAGLVLGAVVERLVIRPVEGGPELNAVIVTLGLFIAIQALISVLFGVNQRAFVAPFSTIGFRVGDSSLALSPNTLFTLGAVLLVMVGLTALFRYTRVGLAMRASAFGQEVARLLGVRVGRMLTLGWALAAVVGSLAGMLIAAEVTFVTPTYMDALIVFGFVAAVLGGLDSPVGAVVGGLLLGLLLSYVRGYVGDELVGLAALAVLVVVLLVRPGGLFSTTQTRRA